MRKLFFSLAVFFAMCPLSFGNNIKEPNVSGQFYDADPAQLSQRIGSYLSQAKTTPLSKDIQILIAPHAGYVYSGSVAAYCYKAISQKSYKTVVILAPSHHYGFDGASVWREGGFRTPLGVVDVDQGFADQMLAADQKFIFEPRAFDQEHSLEVQIPFLQKVLKGFKIVPVIVGQADYETVQKLADALNKIIGDRNDVLVVASSDMSHYHSSNVAREMDQGTLAIIQKMDVLDFWSQCEARKKEMCGFVPVTTAMLLAQKRGLKPEVLHYAHSGDVSGDNSRVVGYSSVIFYKEAAAKPGAETKNEKPQAAVEGVAPLSKEQKKKLVDIVQKTLEEYVRNHKVFEPNVTDARLSEIEGAFVTLTDKTGLRGCIGRIISNTPLYITVRDMAVAASSDDPRFNPVAPSELAGIHFEISVLSKPKQITDPDEIVAGKHGVIVSRGFRSGVFLPQVATEWGWNREQLLSNLCTHKAGLPADAWKDPQTKLEIFTADVFSADDIK